MGEKPTRRLEISASTAEISKRLVDFLALSDAFLQLLCYSFLLLRWWSEKARVIFFISSSRFGKACAEIKNLCENHKGIAQKCMKCANVVQLLSSKGIRVNVTAEFVEPKKLKLRGTVLGIGTTLYWTKIK